MRLSLAALATAFSATSLSNLFPSLPLRTRLPHEKELVGYGGRGKVRTKKVHTRLEKHKRWMKRNGVAPPTAHTAPRNSLIKTGRK